MSAQRKRRRNKLEYPFEEFMEHFQAQEYFLAYESVTRHGEEVELPKLEAHDTEGQFMQTVFKTNDFFRQNYPDVRERTFKFGRFMLIMEFISAHIEELNRGKLAVYGRQDAAVSEALLRAVHERIAVPDLSSLGHGPSIAANIARAEHITGELEPD
jgi:hypothetical protein